MSNVIHFEPRRAEKLTREALRAVVIAEYKGAIYDWCGHHLAIAYASAMTGVPEDNVYAIISTAGNLW